METLSIATVLVLLLLLQVKHWICDAPLQTGWMVAQKGTYGAPGGLAHGGLHGAGTFVCLLLIGVDGVLALALGCADAVAHYHVDYGKQRVIALRNWTYSDNAFWWAMTFDQFLHQATYLAITALAVMAAS